MRISRKRAAESRDHLANGSGSGTQGTTGKGREPSLQESSPVHGRSMGKPGPTDKKSPRSAPRPREVGQVSTFNTPRWPYTWPSPPVVRSATRAPPLPVP